MNDMVYALAVLGSDLYAGGGFTTAGSKVSGCVARAVLADITPPEFTSTAVVGGTNLVSGGTGCIPGVTYYVVASTNVAEWMTNWVRVATNVFGTGGTFNVTNVVDPSKRRQFFRLQVP
jgi:hypothetical protein